MADSNYGPCGYRIDAEGTWYLFWHFTIYKETRLAYREMVGAYSPADLDGFGEYLY